MAISLIGTVVNASNNGNDASCTLPGGMAQNDVCFVGFGEGSTSDLGMAMVTAGYTELTELYANDTTDVNFAVYRKVMGVTPDSTSVGNGSAGSNNSTGNVSIVLRGVNTTTPEDATTTTATGIDAPAPNPPSITTVTSGAWVLAFGGSTSGDIATAPAGYSNLGADTGSESNGLSIMGAVKAIASPAAEDPAAFGGLTAGTGECWCAATVAVRPAVAAAVPRSRGYVIGERKPDMNKRDLFHAPLLALAAMGLTKIASAVPVNEPNSAYLVKRGDHWVRVECKGDINANS